ncbi:MAG: hypothetical protein R2874_07640 [Desulfobacterales bacterium]
MKPIRNIPIPRGSFPQEELTAADQITYTTDPKALSKADFIIVAVPTPIDKRPPAGFITAQKRH